jgi:signal-transduction protein with cAMP-binding, CBS, and nucleotidyltransferase domain
MTVEQSLKEVEVAELELEPPVILDETTDVRAVIAHMKVRRAGYALLTKGDRLTGIFTERDALLRILPDERALDDPIANWMTRTPASVTTRAPLGEVLERMLLGGFRRVVVVDDETRVIACVRHRDIIAYLALYETTQARKALVPTLEC